MIKISIKSKILIIDDDPNDVEFIKDRLEYMGFQVLIARDGIEGLYKTFTELPDLLILDIMLPEIDGYEVCRQLKNEPETKHIPVLMVTALGQLQDKLQGFEIGADDYLSKPYEKAEFEARVRALLKRSLNTPFIITHDYGTFVIECMPGHSIRIRANGPTVQNTICNKILNIDIDVCARQGENAYHHDWRFNSKRIGKELYQQIFYNQYEVAGCYNRVLGEVRQNRKLHLCFESTPAFLRVPIEFLFDDEINNGDYLVLKHPLVRSIVNIHTKQSLTPDFFNDLSSKGEQLRILLIASNTYPDIAGADEEIASLSDSIDLLFRERKIPVKVDVIPTELATYLTIRKRLQNCPYHIVHYAGHGAFDDKSPEKSSLAFWEKENRQGSIIKLFASELKILLKDSNVKFFYLSCCLGAKTGEEQQLLDNDFSGIMDSIIHAGIPSVLGFRWPVSDFGAKELSLAFYTSLAKQGQIDTALLDARCEVAALNRDDITWLSPILIMQTYPT